MESARRSAEGLKITIDADLLPRYLVPRTSRLAIRENPSYISPPDNAVALIFLYAYSNTTALKAMHLIYPRRISSGHEMCGF